MDCTLGGALRNKFLTCALCLGEYREPRMLPCFHSFCTQCLQDLIDVRKSRPAPPAQSSPRDRLCVKCPICRNKTAVESADVAEFKVNFLLVGLQQELVDRQTEECRCRLSNPGASGWGGAIIGCGTLPGNSQTEHDDNFPDRSQPSRAGSATSSSRTRSTNGVLRDINYRRFLENDTKTVFCKLHKDVATHFCERCDTSACEVCVLTHHRAHGDLLTIEQAVTNKTKDLKVNVLRKSSQFSTLLKESKAKISRLKKDVCNTRKGLLTQIEQRKNDLLQLIDQVTFDLQAEVESKTLGEKKRLIVHLEECEFHLASLESISDRAEVVLSSKCSQDILDSEKELSLQIRYMTVFLPLSFTPSKRVGLTENCTSLEDVRQLLGNVCRQ